MKLEAPLVQNGHLMIRGRKVVLDDLDNLLSIRSFCLFKSGNDEVPAAQRNPYGGSVGPLATIHVYIGDHKPRTHVNFQSGDQTGDHHPVGVVNYRQAYST